MSIETDLLTSPDTFASTLLIITVKHLGPEFLTSPDGVWEPTTIKLELKSYTGIELPDDNLSKLMAAISVITTDNLLRGLPSFLATVHGLNGDGIDWSYAEPLDTEDLAWAVTEALFLSPPTDQDIFDSQIVAYCRKVMKTDGIISPPSVLSFAREDNAYDGLSQYDDDVMREQSSRTKDISDFLEEQEAKLFEQIASIPAIGTDAAKLAEAIKAELAELATEDKWL
ncbi:hypothetical protein FACS189443_2970 [Planctomycetales bacterium]|nr:hypothetical protein FACS189443_2970 [Planctomycetales bacterium]